MVFRSIVLMTFLNVLKAAVAVGLSFVIARLVSPSEFGLVTFAISLTMLISLVTDFGIASAIVRERELTRIQAGAAIVLTLVFGAVGGLVMALSSDGLESLTKIEGVSSIIFGFSLVTCFSIWATSTRAILERHLEYGWISLFEAVSLILALFGFWLALRSGIGIFALVVFHVVLHAFRTLLFLIRASSLFEWSLQIGSIKTLLRTGGWIFLSNLLAFAARNIDRYVIGVVLGAASLGLYGFAYQFMTIPLMLIAWPASGVLLSTLSRAKDNDILKKQIVISFITLTAFVTVPLMTYIAYGLPFVINSMFSDKWMGVEVYVSILAPVGVIQSIAVYATAVLVSCGEVKKNFYLSLVNGIFLTILFFVAAPFGIFVVVVSYAVVASSISALMIYSYCKISGIGVNKLFISIFPGLLAGFLIILMYIFVGVFDLSDRNYFLVFSIGCGVVYLGCFAINRSCVFGAVSILKQVRFNSN